MNSEKIFPYKWQQNFPAQRSQEQTEILYWPTVALQSLFSYIVGPFPYRSRRFDNTEMPVYHLHENVYQRDYNDIMTWWKQIEITDSHMTKLLSHKTNLNADVLTSVSSNNYNEKKDKIMQEQIQRHSAGHWNIKAIKSSFPIVSPATLSGPLNRRLDDILSSE